MYTAIPRITFFNEKAENYGFLKDESSKLFFSKRAKVQQINFERQL
jgi:hypothetical protein